MSEKQMEILLRPYLLENTLVPEGLYGQLEQYLELLLKWNARTNLTAIREPEEIVRRHFGESLFAAQHLGECEMLLDFGSGAGFPGVPIQLLRPNLHVTLAESQNKKAAFLREVTRTLGLKAEVWAGRVETMPESQRFDVVTLRAVDDMSSAIASASFRAKRRMVILTTGRQIAPKVVGFKIAKTVITPEADDREIVCLDRTE